MKIPLKLKLFLPVTLIIIVVVTATSIWFVNKSIHTFEKQLNNNLELEVGTLNKMFEREANFKLEKVKTNLNIAEAIFKNQDFNTGDEKSEITVENQLTGMKFNTSLHNWKINNKSFFLDTVLVDSLQALFGSTVTIFQRIDSGFVRISTNVKKADGSRAIGTYIPRESEVCLTILNKKTYMGRAYVVNDWYVTAYKPILIKDSVAGMIYVGEKEKDLRELRSILGTLKIGRSGFPFVFDKNGLLIIHPDKEGLLWEDTSILSSILKNEKGVVGYSKENRDVTMAYLYFKPFDFYIAASVITDIETASFKRDTIMGAFIIGFTAILLLLILIYRFAGKRLYYFFTELQQSRKELSYTTEELVQSEERFRKLFDSTGDDIFVTDENENIVEVNAAVCETLGYSKEELMGMKITEIKSQKYIHSVAENRKIIYQNGSHNFESEHVTKSGTIIPVEFTSRLIHYQNEKLILSVVRNIAKRQETERIILSSVIQAEEKERKRFAKDMHDGLGPLLSTIKLYVNELNSSALSDEERNDLTKQSNEMLDDAVNTVRSISNNIMPRVIHQYGLVKALDSFCEKINKTNQILISFETENIVERLDMNLELILFRVISELINNTIKHAQAKNIIILLVKYESKLSLYFKDDGVGFDMNEIFDNDNKGTGLKNIMSRIKSINGNYLFNSKRGDGFTMRVEISL